MVRPIQPKFNKDHWGFYQVGPFKTYSKLDAIEISGRTKHDIVWNFNNEVFGQYDWTVEPPGDLEFWYRQRAEQLREHYDYIILFLSGGFDSQNILQTFVKNNIFIDEIVNLVNIDGTGNDRHHNINNEIYNTAYPTVTNLIENNPTYKNTKHTIIDVAEIEKRCLSDNKWDYFYKSSKMFCPANHMFGEIRDSHAGLQETHQKYNRVCQLYGIDKIKVQLDDHGNGRAVFHEVAPLAFVHALKQEENKPGTHDEMFYWTPDLPELVCKQAHVILKHLRQLGDHNVGGGHTKVPIESQNVFWTAEFTQKQHNGYFYRLEESAVVDLIYKDHLPVNFGIKPVNMLIGTKDEWLWDESAPDVGQKTFFNGLAWLKYTVKNSRPDLWVETPGTSPRTGFKNGSILAIPNIYKLTKNNA